MSNAALTWAFDSGLDPGPRFVLVVLGDHGSDHSGEDWSCFPAVERIMDKTGFSRSAVERHLKALELHGWLTRTRRRRADGKLGIYDYVLHRDPAKRARLAAARAAAKAGAASDSGAAAAVETASEPPAPDGDLPHGPDGDLPHGPCGELPDAMRRIDGQPCGKSPHQEPSIEPSEEPTPGARAKPDGDDGRREPGDRGFEAALAAWPASGLERTSVPKARAAWALATDRIDAADLLAAVARYVTEARDLKSGDHGAPGLHTWLSDERWRAWLPKGSPGRPAAMVGPVWQGPPELRAAVVAARSEGFASSYLDRSEFDATKRQVEPWSTTAATELGKIAGVFREHGASIGAAKGRGR